MALIVCGRSRSRTQTVQTVSWLSYLYHEMRQYGPFLIIVPLSTITAWQSQLATWAPDLGVVTYIGTALARDTIRRYEFYAGTPGAGVNGAGGSGSKKVKMNVLLTTYEIVLRDAKELGEIKWQVLAVDEVSRGPLLLVSLFAGVAGVWIGLGWNAEQSIRFEAQGAADRVGVGAEQDVI